MKSMSRMSIVALSGFAWGVMLLGAPAPSSREINAHSPQLHRLDPKRIPLAEQRPWHPKELAAILGQQRGRHWLGIGIVSYSPDGKHIAVLAGTCVYIWQIPGLHFQSLLPIQATYCQYVPQESMLLTCSGEGIVQIWKMGSRKPESQVLIRGTDGAFHSPDIAGTVGSPEGKKLVTRSFSGIVIYDTNTLPRKRYIVLLDKDLSLYHAAFSPDARVLATLTLKVENIPMEMWTGPPKCFDHKVTIWDVSGLRPTRLFSFRDGYGDWDRLAFSPDGKTLVCGPNLWNLSKGKPTFRASMAGQNETITACLFSPDSQKIITSSIKDHQSYLCLRDMQQPIPRVSQTMPLTGPYCGALALAPDGKSIALGEMNTLQMRPIKDGRIQVPSPTYGHLSDVTSLSFGACGNLLATAGKDATLRLWDLDGPRPHQRLVLKGESNPWGGDTNPWDSIVLSPDGTKLAAASQMRGLTIWNVSPKGLRILVEHKCGDPKPPKQRWGVPYPPPISLAFTPDSKTLFLANGADPVKIIDLSKPSAIETELKSGERIIYCGVCKPVLLPGQMEFPPESETMQSRDPGVIQMIAVSPDGQTLALGTLSEIEIWKRTEKGWIRNTGFRNASSYCVSSMAFEPSGNTLLVGSRCGNGEVRRFNVSGEKPAQLGETVVHNSPITSVAASPNGHFLAAADRGGRVVVWSANMAKKLHEWNFPGPVHCVSFAPDGRHLALGNGDGTVYILRLTVPTEK